MADAAGCFLGACLRICFSLTPSFDSRVGKIGDLWSRLRWLKSTEKPIFSARGLGDRQGKPVGMLPSFLPPSSSLLHSLLPSFLFLALSLVQPKTLLWCSGSEWGLSVSTKPGSSTSVAQRRLPCRLHIFPLYFLSSLGSGVLNQWGCMIF